MKLTQKTTETRRHGVLHAAFPSCLRAFNDAYGFGENVLPHPEIIAELKKELLSL